jgi:hypothetical protein
MFYVYNVSQWIDEVIDNCNRNSLDPEDSVFMLLIFSSLDFEYVSFFRDRKPQISQFSGENFHIFTPIIYDDVVPDGEWRVIRDEFNQSGIRIGSDPSAIFFHLDKRQGKSGYSPEFFAAYECPSFVLFERALRRIVEAGIRFRRDPRALEREFAQLFSRPNLMSRGGPKPYLASAVAQKVNAPRFFISYSHKDKDFVAELYQSLRERRVDLWLDREELNPGVQLTDALKDALRSCDGLITVLSGDSIGSKWLQFEGSFFSSSDGKPIIPVVLDDAAKRGLGDLPFLKDRLYADFSDPASRDKALDTLTKAIRNTNG